MRGRKIEELKIGINGEETDEARVMDHSKGLAFVNEIGSLECFEQGTMETLLVSKPFFLPTSNDMM